MAMGGRNPGQRWRSVPAVTGAGATLLLPSGSSDWLLQQHLANAAVHAGRFRPPALVAEQRRPSAGYRTLFNLLSEGHFLGLVQIIKL